MVRRTFSGYVLVLAALALPGHSAEAASPRYSYVTSRLRPSLRLFPSVEMRGQAVMIRVTHIDVPSLEVNVAGGTSVHGQPLRWRPLRFSNGAWRAGKPERLQHKAKVARFEIKSRDRQEQDDEGNSQYETDSDDESGKD